MAKSNTKTKPAFPGRSNAMGYESGLSKLEWLTAQVYQMTATHNIDNDVIQAVEVAKAIIKQCEDVEASES